MMNRMRILAIETSCDETAIAMVEASGGIRAPRFKVLKNLVASQIPVHRPFGGVVPGLAKREHLKNLPILYRQILGKSQVAKRALNLKNDSRLAISAIRNVDLVAVTVGPGLEPALWTGITFAKELANELKVKGSKLKVAGTNHLEGHLYSFLLPQKNTSRVALPMSQTFPAIALLVSGGHTELLLMKSLTKWKKLGATRDDAAGEAFDKVARMLGLPYPGGPEIEKIAQKGNPAAINFPRPMLNQKNYDFSFSGLKTAVFYRLRDMKHATSDMEKTGIAASFQAAVIDVLVQKTIRAAQEFKAKSVILCGGVAMNRALRASLKLKIKSLKLNFLVPDFAYNTDNAAMIAAAAYINAMTKKKYKLEARGDLDI